MHIIKLLTLLFVIFGCSSGGSSNYMSQQTSSMEPDMKVIRTDFSSDANWNSLCKIIETPNAQYGFKAYVELVNDTSYRGLSIERIADELKDYNYGFFFVADERTFSSTRFPIMCVEIPEDTLSNARAFRIKASDLWIAQNNLSIYNMDFEDFSEHVDSEGVYVPY